MTAENRQPKPAWLKKRLPQGGDYQRVRRLLAGLDLHTVCQEARCPNMFECFSKDTATFLILGSECTRNCRFCNVNPMDPVPAGRLPLDPDEPRRVAEAVLKLKLKYVVLTSVTRDDLDDGGAAHFAATIRAVRSTLPESIKIEVLIPDFQGSETALKTVLDARPDVLNHNIETVPDLYDIARPQADYQRSCRILSTARRLNPALPLKSGIMVGLGEILSQLEDTMKVLFDHGCNMLTVGQYLQPTRAHLPVEKYYTPEDFDTITQLARRIGFKKVTAGAFVRSSYQARELFEASM